MSAENRFRWCVFGCNECWVWRYFYRSLPGVDQTLIKVLPTMHHQRRHKMWLGWKRGQMQTAGCECYSKHVLLVFEFYPLISILPPEFWHSAFFLVYIKLFIFCEVPKYRCKGTEKRNVLEVNCCIPDSFLLQYITIIYTQSTKILFYNKILFYVKRNHSNLKD